MDGVFCQSKDTLGISSTVGEQRKRRQGHARDYKYASETKPAGASRFIVNEHCSRRLGAINTALLHLLVGDAFIALMIECSNVAKLREDSNQWADFSYKPSIPRASTIVLSFVVHASIKPNCG